MEPLMVNALIVLATAWGGTKAAMNGINKRLERMEGKQDWAAAKLHEHSTSIAVLEAANDRVRAIDEQ